MGEMTIQPPHGGFVIVSDYDDGWQIIASVHWHRYRHGLAQDVPLGPHCSETYKDEQKAKLTEMILRRFWRHLGAA